MATRTAPTLADIRAAQARLGGVARITPVYSSDTLGRLSGRPIVLKAETLQRTGAFKIRGAFNKLANLVDAEREAGVVCASAGNHAQAVAWAARELGVAATVFMPQDAAMAKVDATRHYGAEIVLRGEGYDDAQAAATDYAGSSGATMVHPFDDPHVIAGQATIGLELADQLDEVETVVVPVGGGGLASGVAIALGELRPEIKLVGVQAAACAPFAGSERTGFTIADGIAVKRPGELTGAILRERLDGVVTVTDNEIAQAIVLLLERAKLMVEGAGAAPVAALLAGKVAGTGPACAILSGGNIDPMLLTEVMRYGLSEAGRFLSFRTKLEDRPGELARLSALLASERVNVLGVEHRREGLDLAVAEAAIELTVGTRDEEHCQELLQQMRDWGYRVERLR